MRKKGGGSAWKEGNYNYDKGRNDSKREYFKDF